VEQSDTGIFLLINVKISVPWGAMCVVGAYVPTFQGKLLLYRLLL
jgi:hypothetical protein